MLAVSGRLGHKVKVVLLRKAQKLFENKAVCYFKILLTRHACSVVCHPSPITHHQRPQRPQLAEARFRHFQSLRQLNN